MLRILVVLVALVGGIHAQCDEKDCPIGGIVAGCIIGTLVFCAIIAVIVWLVLRKRQRRQQGNVTHDATHKKS